AVDASTVKACSLSHRKRAGVRGYGFSEARTPSPGAVATTLCVAVSADLPPSGRGESAVGALRLGWRQGGSFGTEPFARGGFRLGAVLRTEIRECLVEHGVAPAGGFRDKVPVEALDLVHRRALSRSEEHTSELQSPYDLVCRL